MPNHTFAVKALPVTEAPAHRAGCCVVCSAALGGFAPARGRDSPRDDASFFTDRFCSRACYHAYGRMFAGRASVARWN